MSAAERSIIAVSGCCSLPIGWRVSLSGASSSRGIIVGTGLPKALTAFGTIFKSNENLLCFFRNGPLENIVEFSMITLALPSRGRLAQEAELLVKKVGLNTERPYRSLQTEVITSSIKLVFVHHKDAGMLVEQGYVDLAVTAQDILAEHPNNVSVLTPLGFGKCQVVLAVQEDMPIHNVRDLEGQIVATSYPRLARMWLAQQRVQCKIVPLHGSLEIMPALGLATGIVDNYQTGVSTRANHLRVIETLMSSQAVLIGKEMATSDDRTMQFTRLLSSAATSFQEALEGVRIA
jgi:ATP phosphoribosyltransferase